MTALQLVQGLQRLQAEHGPGAMVNRLPLGVLEAERRRAIASSKGAVTTASVPVDGVGPAKAAPSPLSPVPADIADAWRKGPGMVAGHMVDEYGIIHDFPLLLIARFACAHPEAVAIRHFQYRRKGFPLAEVSCPCLHWQDGIGNVRATTLHAVDAPGRCQVCVGEFAHLKDLCPGCGGSHKGKVYLLAGQTYLDHLPTHLYWRIQPLKAA